MNMDEVQLSADPNDDLPSELLSALEQFVLGVDSDEGSERLELLVQISFEGLSDGSLDALIVRLSELTAGDRRPAKLLPAFIADHLVQVDDKAVALRRWTAFSDIVNDYSDLFADTEKLVGHLVLKHRTSLDLRSLDEQALISAHAAIHTGFKTPVSLETGRGKPTNLHR
ncbi:MAG TPA: hypothetical protein VMY88_03415 [Acidimicrobiales bacterium]|nr:hypothetical protein [Acidimicrobiales bacterium]